MTKYSSVKIAVLLCTYNGENHIGEQLDSIKRQSLPNIDIWISDDGSIDSTVEQLKSFQNNWKKGRFEITSGPRQGFAANFLSLVCDSTIEADYYAYSDQDDVWEPDKLTRAITCLESYGHKPALYCSRTRLIAECGEDMRRWSPKFARKPSFANAIVQSLAGGNTMVLNNKARELLLKAGMQNIIGHDWWTYMLVSGADGSIIYDSTPSVQYRQHGNNEMGANLSWRARWCRVKMLFSGDFHEWNDINTRALHKSRNLLSENNRSIFDTFVAARQARVIKRIYLILKSGIYRQTVMGNIALGIAALLNKL